MTFKLTHAKNPLKFCAFGLFLISIGTCVPTALAQSQAGADETHLYSLPVTKVTPLYTSLWTGAILFFPQSLENFKIVYLYPKDTVKESDKRDIDNYLPVNLINDQQLDIKRPASDASDDSSGNFIATDSRIQNLAKHSEEQIYWTSPPNWEKANNWFRQGPMTDENVNPRANPVNKKHLRGGNLKFPHQAKLN